MSKNRTRNNRIVFRLDDNELAKLEGKMERLGVRNREALVRKFVLDGYIIQVDTKPYADFVQLLQNISGNVNQVAKRANETGSVYEDDVLDLLVEINKLKPLVVDAHKNAVELGKQ
jgi:hypothetical protein